MTPLEIAIVMMVSAVAGMLVALALDASLLGIYVKVPGRECARYWSAGSALILASSMALFRYRAESAVLPGSLIVAGFLLGHVLQWRGLQIFFFRPPDPYAWPLAAVFFVGYVAQLMQGLDFQVRLAFLSIVPMIVWPACLAEILRVDQGRRLLPAMLACAGLALMIAAAGLDILGPFIAPLRATLAARPLAAAMLEMVLPIFGAILYLAGLVLMYFDRVAEHTNYAATHDELTGLLNRRAIMAAGRREVDAALRNRQSLVAAFLDIDHFKKINDTHGHDVGDMVLRETARVLQECCRSVDLVGRYGGEEFCMVFPGDHHGGAHVIGERLVAAVRGHAFPDFPDKVTVSVGLVPLQASMENIGWEQLLYLADIELYRAKQNGRDMYCVYGQEVPKTAAAPAKRRQSSTWLNRTGLRF